MIIADISNAGTHFSKYEGPYMNFEHRLDLQNVDCAEKQGTAETTGISCR